MAGYADRALQAVNCTDWLACHCTGPVTAAAGRRGVQLHIGAQQRPDILDAQRVMTQSGGKFQMVGRWELGRTDDGEAVVGLHLRLVSPVECALTLLFELPEDLWILELIALVGWVVVVAGPDCPQAAATWYGTPWVNLVVPQEPVRALVAAAQLVP